MLWMPFSKTRLLLGLSICLMLCGHAHAANPLQAITVGAVHESPITVYLAQDIVTLDPAKPQVTAVAVQGKRIFATGTQAQVLAAIGTRPHTIDKRFASKVLVPGFIAQHDHPLLAGITMTSNVIAIEDWVLPDKTFKAAKNHAEYIARRKKPLE